MTLDFERTTLYLSVAMSNPANQLPSYELDNTSQANNNYFCIPVGHAPSEIKNIQVVVQKENREEVGL